MERWQNMELGNNSNENHNSSARALINCTATASYNTKGADDECDLRAGLHPLKNKFVYIWILAYSSNTRKSKLEAI